MKRPQKTTRPAKAAHIPASVRRAVWARDKARCQWLLDAGGTCNSTLRLEIDHVRLMDRRLSHKGAVLALYGIAVVLGGVAVALFHSDAGQTLA